MPLNRAPDEVAGSAPAAGDGDAAMAFVVGCARSGTTILAELIGAHPAVRFIFEPHHVWESGAAPADGSHRLLAADATPELRAHIRGWFAGQRGGARVVLDKTPRNVLRIPFLRTVFPGGKIIHIVRDGRDVACSLRPGIGGAEWSHLKPPSWRGLMERHSGIERCALAWRDTMEIALADLAAVPHLQVRYERLVAEPASVAREALDFLGLAEAPEVFGFCAKIQDDTGGPYHAARQDHWYRADHRRRTGRWRENLDTAEQRMVQARLGGMLDRLGYE